MTKTEVITSNWQPEIHLYRILRQPILRRGDFRPKTKRGTVMAKLTEQDIINWNGPEEEYMNEDQLAFFRELLVKQQDELIENASNTATELKKHETAPDPADRATQEEEYALELRTRDRERKLLGKIQATIRLIDEGEYGYCQDTGEPIGLKRLLARPTATLSVEAQERRERMKKQFAD